MEYRTIDEKYSVSAQIAPADVAAIKAAGFRSIIGNRPDSEDGAVPHGEIEQAARDAGLVFRFIPVVASAITPENVADQAKALEELPGPVLAYCRSGARCTNLYGLVQNMKRG